MPESILLLCTVGGSHEPILTAIRQSRPDFVCFVCSEDDPTTGRPGSWTQIEKPGKVIKARPSDDKPSLPNMPVQLDLPAERFEVLRIPADDLDPASAAIRRRLGEPRERSASARRADDLARSELGAGCLGPIRSRRGAGNHRPVQLAHRPGAAALAMHAAR